MSPLTSPAQPGCLSCILLADKISKLGKRIFTLYEAAEIIAPCSTTDEARALSLDEPSDKFRTSNLAADAPLPAAAGKVPPLQPLT